MKINIKNCEFVYSTPKLSLMRDLSPELAFVGRSNAGKSSLINALCQSRDLARTSKTPGRTRHAVAYDLVLSHEDQERHFTLIDLPGFGYALMSKTEAMACEKLIFSYLAKRKRLKLIVLLLDIRRDIDDREKRIIDIAKERGIPYLIVLTKSDKLSLAKRKPQKIKLARELAIEESTIMLHTTNNARTSSALREAIYNY